MNHILFHSISDSRIPIAITDSNLTLQYGNKSLYTMIGSGDFFSIYTVVHPTDRMRLSESIKQITTDKSFTDVFSILYNDNQYHHMLLNFNYVSHHDLIKIEFQYLSDIINQHSKQTYEIKKYRTLFTLDGDTLFEYNPETKRFKLYWINDTQNIMKYHGNFSLWQQNVTSSGQIADIDHSTFVELCLAVENETPSFEYQFISSILTDGDIYETTKVKGRTILNHHGKKVVVGVFLLFNTAYNFKENNFIDTLYKDELTGLLNKREITRYANNTLKNNPDYPVHLLILDLDNFKQCNDTYGHMFGDEILKAVSSIVKNSMQQHGVAGRIGGDEFMIILENVESETLLRNILRSIRANIQWLYKDKLSYCQLNCSMGVATYPKDSNDYDTLFKIADYSLYMAKRQGKGRYVIYDSEKHGPVTCNTGDNSILTSRLPATPSAKTLVDLKEVIASLYLNGRQSIPETVDTLKSFYSLHNIKMYLPIHTLTKDMDTFPIIECNPSLFAPEYIKQFTEADSFCVTNIKNIEFTFQQIYSNFAQKTSTSFYQCLVRDFDGTITCIMSYERSTVHNSWSTDIRQILNLVSSIIGNVFFHS